MTTNRMLPIIGFLLLLGSLAGVAFVPRAALTGWLAAFCLASAASLGSLVFLMLAEIVPGPWRHSVMPSAASLSLLNLMLLPLCLPVIAGLKWIYPWAGDTSLSGFKAAYLSPVFFSLRLLVILGAAGFLSWSLARMARRPLAVAGLMGLVLADTLLATDLMQSLDPDFHSSGFGLYILSLQLLTAYSVLLWIEDPMENPRPGLSGVLFLCLLLFWAYFFFMQYFVLWSGNLPHPAAWFQRRGQGGWQICEALLAALRLIPPAVLLFGPARRSRMTLRALALVSLAGSMVEFAWLVLPELHEDLRFGILSFLLATSGSFLLFRVVPRRLLPAMADAGARP